ncbi:RNA-directed DNA polymerase, eukaryota, reverse transcriptase zinc-binding domain protein [Tanacetum coccineum]
MVKWIVRCVTYVSFFVCVNGERFRHLKGGRGLRKGDPMSPYLFTLVMEIISLIVQKKVEERKDFRYHFGCKQLKLTHFCFVDDLLMFCHGDVVSVGVLKEYIEEFGVISCLLPNYSKSTIVFGSMRMKDQQIILNCVPFKVEKLPVKYLGVHLTSKRIGANNYKSLIDKVKSRVSNWRNKCLSYTGRLQLISSIMESIHVSWASVFLLFQGVIKHINKILKGFLWIQGELSRGKAKVNTVKLKGKSIWAVNEEVIDSWGWKNMLRLRDDCNAGILQSFLTHRDMYNGRVKADTAVKEICITLDSSKSDELVWRSRSGKESKFSVKQAYDDLKGRVEEFWAKAKSKMGVNFDDMDWNGLINSVSKLYNGNSIYSVVGRLGSVACVYLIWQERNGRIFKNEKRSPTDLFDALCEIIRMRLMSLKVKNLRVVLRVQQQWNVKLQISMKSSRALYREGNWSRCFASEDAAASDFQSAGVSATVPMGYRYLLVRAAIRVCCGLCSFDTGVVHGVVRPDLSVVGWLLRLVVVVAVGATISTTRSVFVVT